MLKTFSYHLSHHSFPTRRSSDLATAINSLTTDAQQLAVYDSEKVTELDDKRIIEGGKFTQTAADPSFTSTVEVVAVTVMDVGVRSEERRVGKECRSWWSPCY